MDANSPTTCEMTPQEQAEWDARKQPACGNPEPHLPHDGFAGGRNRDPWCHGVPKQPRGVSLDDRLYEAFLAGWRAQSRHRDQTRSAFEEWKEEPVAVTEDIRPTHQITKRKITKVVVTDEQGHRYVFEGTGSMSTYNPNRHNEDPTKVLDVTMKVDDA